MRRRLLPAALLLLCLGAGHGAVVHFVRLETSGRTVAFEEERAPAAPPVHLDWKRQVPPAWPMREIDPFDEDARNWSSIFGLFHSGLAVFDANGDGLLDVYFCQDGQNWARPTDADGALLDRPRAQHNALYLNQGNDPQGNPRFAQVSRLVEASPSYARQELLVENFLFPRGATTDSPQRPARQSAVAAAADFDGDGRTDLLVGNALPGMAWSHPQTQRILPPMAAPVGRQVRRSRRPVAAFGLYLIDYEPRENTSDRRLAHGGEEAMGANTLFLNQGDRDGDGVPEWEDASQRTGIQGQRHTVSFAVADIDLDGDLDVYEANVMDFDYWPGGAQGWAGAANQLYVNQLAQTGELRFAERAAELGVDGLYGADRPMIEHYRLRRLPLLPDEYSLLFFKLIPYHPEILAIDGVPGEAGQISWASLFQDVDGDGYPDLWVANDYAELDLYLNQGGRGFALAPHARSGRIGSWMSFAPGDFNGDLEEDLFVGNMGGGTYANSFIVADPFAMFDPVIVDGAGFALYANGYYDTRHFFIDGRDPTRTLANRVHHSPVLPPDATLPSNIRSAGPLTGFDPEFDRHSIDPYEFAWGSTAFDLYNDGSLSLYFAGNMAGRGGGLASVLGTGPGRLLVNLTRDRDQLVLADLTAEHHLFNILDLDYTPLESEGYFRRRAPALNWGKRDVVYSYDRSVWISQGPLIQERIANHDMIQTAENGRVSLATDLNHDGYADLILRNMGGYDSRSPEGKNLRGRTPDQRLAVLPPHDQNYPVPTNYEAGGTRLFINQYTGNNWLKVRLVDDRPGSFNRDAIGAVVILDGQYLRIKRATQGSHIANRLEDLHFGLGQERAHSLRVIWPDRTRSASNFDLDGYRNGTLVVSQRRGLVAFEPLD